METQTEAKKPFYKKTWFIIVASLWAVAIIGGIVNPETPDPEQKPYAEMTVNEQEVNLTKRLKEHFEVVDFVHDIVKAQLKSPSSAVFKGDDGYRVLNVPSEKVIYTGTLEAQNAFGVMLQSKYKVIFTYANDNIKVVSAEVE